MIAIQILTLEKECLFPRASLGTFKSCTLCNYSKYIFLFKNLIFITTLRISCNVFLIVLPSPIQFPPDPPQLPYPLTLCPAFVVT